MDFIYLVISKFNKKNELSATEFTLRINKKNCFLNKNKK